MKVQLKDKYKWKIFGWIVKVNIKLIAINMVVNDIILDRMKMGI